MNTFRFTLPNGLQAVQRQSLSEVVCCGLTINAGTRDEAAAEHGVAHFTEHMLFKGTKKHSAYFINNRLESVGGELNAFTTKEETVIHATIMKNDVGKALELLAEMAFNPTFPLKEIEKEKLIVFDEINAYKDNPSEQIFDDFEELLFGKAPIGRSILGSERSLRTLTQKRIQQFTARYYRPQNAVLSMVGKFNPKQFEKLTEKYFGGFQAPPFVRQYTAPAPYVPFHVTQSRNTYQAHCILGNRTYSLHHPKHVAMALFANYLGGPASNSMLNTLLREKHGLAYTVEVNYNPYVDCGALTIYFGTDKEKIKKCCDLIFAALEKLRKAPIEGRLLQRIKKQFVGQLTIASDNTEAQMLSQAKNIITFNKIETLEEINEKIYAVTPADMFNIAEESLNPDTLSTLIYT